jgi:chemotaxis protein MotB
MKAKPAIALLCGAMLLSACVPTTRYEQQVQKSATYQQLDAQLKAEFGGDQAKIQQLKNLVKLTLSAGLLFPEGGWEVSQAGKAMLARVAPTLTTLTGQRIVVKGFTDDLPIGEALRPRFANNVQLSKARADAVAAVLVEQGVPARLITTSGLGEAHPVASNATPAGRAQNRRVEIDIVEAPA